jgi:sensory rhodopsin
VLDGILGWLLYILGSAAFLGVIYYAMYDFDDAVQQKDDSTVALYRKLRAFLIVLWLVYPFIWVLAPVGLGLMNIETSALVISYLDIVAKVGFGLIALSGQLVVTEASDPAGVTAD